MNKYVLLALVFGGVVASDQLSKYEAVAHLTSAFDHTHAVTFSDRLSTFITLHNLDGEPIPTEEHPDLRSGSATVLENFWHFKYVENPGAAWGFLSRVYLAMRVPFFHLVSIAAIIFIIYFFRKLREDQRYLQVALGLVLGGAVGNYIDRLVRSYVIDFIDWHWYQAPNLHWPTFNVADSAICVGVAMMILENVFVKPPAAVELAEDGKAVRAGKPVGDS